MFMEIGYNYNLVLDLFCLPWIVYLSQNQEANDNTLVSHTILNSDAEVE